MPEHARRRRCKDASMRVLIAPDKFAGTLTAVEAAEAIAAGWRRHAPDDELDLAPMADGGPGFVDVLHAALGGSLDAVTVSGPHGEPVPAVVLRVGTTAYVESAQAAGLHLVDGVRPRPPRAWGGRAGAGRGRPAARRRSWSGWAGPAPTTVAPASWPRSARTPTACSTAGAAALAAVTTVDLVRGTSTARRRHARRGERRRQPADRPLRGHQDLRPAEGHRRGPDRRGRRLARGASPPPPTGVRRWRRAPAPPAASATPCSSSAPPASRASTWSPTRCRWPSAPARPTWS